MPAPRRSQSNAMLYTVVVFVGISIIASVIAVVFYIKYEDQQANIRQAQSNFSEMVSDQDWRRIASIVGEKKTRETCRPHRYLILFRIRKHRQLVHHLAVYPHNTGQYQLLTSAARIHTCCRQYLL